MKIALAQFEVVRGAPSTNITKIRELVAQSKARGGRVVFLPEMCTTGFDWSRNLELLNKAAEHRAQIAAFAIEFNVAICGSFLEQTESGRPANTLYFLNELERSPRNIERCIYSHFSVKRSRYSEGRLLSLQTRNLGGSVAVYATI